MSYSSRMKKRQLLLGFFAIAVFWGSPYMAGYGMDGFRFLTYFLCIYIVSKLCFDEVNLNNMGLIYGGLTGTLLAVCNFGTFLKGWNPNSLAIQAFQMLMIFCVGFNTDYEAISVKKGNGVARFRLVLFAALVLYAAYLMETLECRSASLILIIAAVFMIKNKWVTGLFKNKLALLIMVIMPLLVAIITISASKMPQMPAWNAWSMQHFKKTLFNGRDHIWETGLQWFYMSPLWGRGNINYGNWHNSAIACLASFGGVGYFIYVTVFNAVLYKSSFYLDDVFIRKGMIAFFAVNIQQSFENTICQSGLMILHPYIILGIILGRIMYIEHNKHLGEENV